MASAELSRRVEKVVGYPPLVEMDARQRWEFTRHCSTPERLRTCRKVRAAILKAEQNRPQLRLVTRD
jgi:hypothetical protein